MMSTIVETILFVVSYAFILLVAIDLIQWSYTGQTGTTISTVATDFAKSMVDLPIKMIIIVVNIVLYLIEAVINMILGLLFIYKLCGPVHIDKLKYSDYA